MSRASSPEWQQHVDDGSDSDCSNDSDCADSDSHDTLEEYHHEGTPSHAMPYMRNKYRWVVHDFATIHTMLQGLKPAGGEIAAHTMSLFEHRMKRRELWKFSTEFRIATYELKELQITHRKSKGMDQVQALHIQNKINQCASGMVDYRLLLLGGLPNDVRGNEDSLNELMSTLLWNQEHEKLMHTVQSTSEYRNALQRIGRQELNAAGYLPRPLCDANTPAHMRILINILGVGVAVRMMRDNVSAQSAVECVLRAKLLDAVFFFG